MDIYMRFFEILLYYDLYLRFTQKPNFIYYLYQRFSTCGIRTTSGKRKVHRWYVLRTSPFINKNGMDRSH